MAIAAERNEGPAAAVSLRMGGDECQLPTLWLTFEFAVSGWYLPRGFANRLAYHIQGVDALRPRTVG